MPERRIHPHHRVHLAQAVLSAQLNEGDDYADDGDERRGDVKDFMDGVE